MRPGRPNWPCALISAYLSFALLGCAKSTSPNTDAGTDGVVVHGACEIILPQDLDLGDWDEARISDVRLRAGDDGYYLSGSDFAGRGSTFVLRLDERGLGLSLPIRVPDASTGGLASSTDEVRVVYRTFEGPCASRQILDGRVAETEERYPGDEMDCERSWAFSSGAWLATPRSSPDPSLILGRGGSVLAQISVSERAQDLRGVAEGFLVVFGTELQLWDRVGNTEELFTFSGDRIPATRIGSSQTAWTFESDRETSFVHRHSVDDSQQKEVSGLLVDFTVADDELVSVVVEDYLARERRVSVLYRNADELSVVPVMSWVPETGVVPGMVASASAGSGEYLVAWLQDATLRTSLLRCSL